MYLCINKYFNMRKVWIPHCPFLIDKIFSVTSPSLFFFRIRILIDSHIYMNCSYISEKISKFFHGLIFRNLKITKITKMILATINLPKGTHLKASGPYQNAKVRLKVSELYRKLYLCFCPNFQVRKKKKKKAEKRFCSKFVLTF